MLSDWVGPHCNISCIDDHGHYADPNDGMVDNAEIVPIFQCIHTADGGQTFTAWFGYRNPNPNNIYIPSPYDNGFFDGTALLNDTSPPTKFIPGEIPFAVKIG